MTYSPLQYTNINGIRTAYRVAGEASHPAQEILLVHGWASSSRMWQTLMDSLSPRFRCWALDIPGFGDSQDVEADDWHTVPNYVGFVREFAAQVNLRQANVIGHSMGGLIALALAAEHPQTVQRLIAINPVVTGLRRIDLRLLSALPFGWRLLAFGRWIWPLANSNLFAPWLGRQRAAAVRRIVEDWDKATPRGSAAALRAMAGCHLADRLHRIAAPTLIIVGSRDVTAPNREGRLAARAIRGARLEALPAGHLPTDDVPAKTLGLVESFLLDGRPGDMGSANAPSVPAAKLNAWNN